MCIDNNERSQALNRFQSFIVQAPAGSGKTELLIQRFLLMLAHVNAPEEILAITFTRKAAAEMRNRIIKALLSVQNNQSSDPDCMMVTFQLAKQALQNNDKKNWQLLNNPNRLQIKTIDAFNAMLTRQMPLLSGFGAQPQVIENAYDHYLNATRSLLSHLETNQPSADAVKTLLLHLDNRHDNAEQLLVNMLAHRDQWLPYVVGQHDLTVLRNKLENGLKHITEENLYNCSKYFPKALMFELIPLINFAASNQQKGFAVENLPGARLSDLPVWRFIAETLLTKSFQWRTRVNVRDGFPSDKPDEKKRIQALLEELSSEEHLRISLADLLQSPPLAYNKKQWQLVKILIETLPLLVAELKLIFHKENQVDFTEISLATLEALGTADEPTDLALYLDYKISHLLIDEFQDTSISQFRLLEQLTAGWQIDDGRTLFLVGDPMQSIYRFREAEVGLFIKTRNEGIGNIKLVPLTLSVNFRSNSNLIHWANKNFEKIFPKQENISSGAISYTPASAYHNDTKQTAVNIHPLCNMPVGDYIVKLVTEIKQQHPQQSIAILVRSRSHLSDIIPCLKKNGLNFTGVNVEPLGHISIVQDLLALTKALLHPADKLSWLSILRAPWCGLKLADLHQLAGSNSKQILFTHAKNCTRLSQDGQLRLQRVIHVLQTSIEHRNRLPLRDWVEGTWLALGGPACVNYEDLSYVKAYFHLLDSLDISKIYDFETLENKTVALFAPSPDNADPNLQIMTIHKAKGLEFDTVIIPCLERKVPYDEHKLLIWAERPRSHGKSDLILAPIKAATDTEDTIYQHLRRQEHLKSRYEAGRLLYVASTRAKQSLHLLADSPTNVKYKPPANSFLTMLWDNFATVNTESSQHSVDEKEASNTEEMLHPLKRLKSNWKMPIEISADKITLGQTHIPWTSQAAMQIGTVIHACFQKLGEQGLNNTNVDKLFDKNMWKQQLIKAGMLPDEIMKAFDKIERALQQAISDPKAQWLFDKHCDDHCEYAITTTIDENVQHLIIDRTFIDEDGIRWIIDYKTTAPDEEPLSSFLSKQKANYRLQLETYAKAMQQFEQRTIKCALYFPLCSAWIEWAYANETIPATGQ